MRNTALRFAIFLLGVGVVTPAPGAAAARHGSLRAGAARVDITPPVNPEFRPPANMPTKSCMTDLLAQYTAK